MKLGGRTRISNEIIIEEMEKKFAFLIEEYKTH